MVININSKIFSALDTKPVLYAVDALKRDMKRVFNVTSKECNNIYLLKVDMEKESFRIQSGELGLEIRAADDLGFIYGIYEVSRTLLDVHDLWFWNDQQIAKKSKVEIPTDYTFDSNPFRVRLRGWFVNDEVLLHTWKIDGDGDKPWEMVFETLLRLGGNMIIPGTDKNAVRYRKMASNMGLMITHHHAEPLGAEMFSRAYPDLYPSYDRHQKEFEKLWHQAIEAQKEYYVIWNLGFRGQGDCPFWENDPKYQADEERGALISKLIQTQYEMVKSKSPDAVCCTNLYGETMELYQKGVLPLPDDVIKIWADNGYGKMVTRRQGNHNPRVPSLPQKADRSRQGIYYHVSFYDLQAANHITMLPNHPNFVKKELEKILDFGVDDYWIVNCSNVKPHVYYLDFIAQMWQKGDIDINEHLSVYVKRYYGEKNKEEIAECIKEYFECPPAFGNEEDEHAGEQFANHNVRILISSFMKYGDNPAEEVMWAVNRSTLREQILWFQERYAHAENRYREYYQKCKNIQSLLKGGTKELFRDSILLQAQIYYHCYKGAAFAMQSIQKALDQDYLYAFYLAGRSQEEYLCANANMRQREHGKWQGFYENECLTDMKQTAWLLLGYMSYIRNMGDGPHFYEWQREFLYSPEDKKVLLLLNMENHLKDEELYHLMKEKEGRIKKEK